jgi:hypothetical protein
MSLSQLVEGWYNLTKKEFGSIPEDLKILGEERAAVCTECELYVNGICNPRKKIPHAKTGEMVSGCGCMLAAKVLCKTCECPAGKW